MKATSAWKRDRVAVVGRLPAPLRQVVTGPPCESGATRARRRRVVSGVAVVGTGLLAVSLSARPGSRQFYATAGALAATWAAGGLASGPLDRGWIEDRDGRLRRPLLTPAATGAAAFGAFYAAARVARGIPSLDSAVGRALSFAVTGDDALVLATALANGVGEEVFFRGALYAAFGDNHPVAASTAVYALVTSATRNPALVAAAGAMGTLFALQRRASGGVQAPTITHLVWSALMVRALPKARSQASAAEASG
jgi:membrane protease YdiL (CAAX protease family)